MYVFENSGLPWEIFTKSTICEILNKKNITGKSLLIIFYKIRIEKLISINRSYIYIYINRRIYINKEKYIYIYIYIYV